MRRQRFSHVNLAELARDDLGGDDGGDHVRAPYADRAMASDVVPTLRFVDFDDDAAPGAIPRSPSAPNFTSPHRLAGAGAAQGSQVVDDAARAATQTAAALTLSDAQQTLFRHAKSGMLLKKGFRFLRRWVPRYVSLHGRVLSYFQVRGSMRGVRRAGPRLTALRAAQGPELAAPRGTLELTSDTAVQACVVDGRRFAIRVAPPAQSATDDVSGAAERHDQPAWIFAAASDEERVRVVARPDPAAHRSAHPCRRAHARDARPAGSRRSPSRSLWSPGRARPRRATASGPCASTSSWAASSDRVASAPCAWPGTSARASCARSRSSTRAWRCAPRRGAPCCTTSSWSFAGASTLRRGLAGRSTAPGPFRGVGRI